MNAAYVPEPQEDIAIISHTHRKPRTDAKWTVHCDGATHSGSPSSMGGIGLAVFADGLLVYAQHLRLVGQVTNQVSELLALTHALQWCVNRGIQTVTVKTDSQFAVNAVLGNYNMRSPHCKRLTNRVIDTLLPYLDADIQHVPRTERFQMFTDFLSNQGNVIDKSYWDSVQHEALLRAYYQWSKKWN